MIVCCMSKCALARVQCVLLKTCVCVCSMCEIIGVCNIMKSVFIVNVKNTKSFVCMFLCVRACVGFCMCVNPTRVYECLCLPYVCCACPFSNVK